MRRMSQKGKERERRGTGAGANYKPWIQTGEFGSKGTVSNPIDWKTGRQVQLLSQGEVIAWYLLRWDDDNLDVREQFPLDIAQTQNIAAAYGIKHPVDSHGNPIVMTTDFLVTRANGEMAISIKSDLETVSKSKRLIEKLFIEKVYWKKQGIPFSLYTKADMNRVMADNIRNVVAFYNQEFFTDEVSLLKKLIARKLIDVDMSLPLNFRDLLQQYKGEIRKWIQWK